MKTLRKWWKLALAIVVLLIAAQAGVSLLVRTHHVHGYLVAHLERAFGRPVEVGISMFAFCRAPDSTPKV
jgi:hypothetical protein